MIKNFILALFIIYSPFQLRLPQWDFVNVANVFLLVLFFIFILQRNHINVKTAVDLPLLLFICVWFFSFIHSLLAPGNDMWRVAIAIEFKRIFTLVFAYFVFAKSLNTKKDVNLLFGVFVFTIFLVGLHTWRNGTLEGVNFADFKRSSGPFAEDFKGSDIAGGFLATFIPFLLTYSFFEKRLAWQIAGFAGTGISLFGLLATYSRGSMIALGASFILIILFSLRRLSRVSHITKIAIIIIALGGSLGWKMWVPQTIVNRIDGTVQEGSYDQTRFDESSEKRMAIWASGIEVFKENPIFGAGFKQVQHKLGVDTHNSFILIMAEMGLVGFLIFLWLLFAIFKEAVGLFKTQNIAIGMGFIGCLSGFVLVNMFYSNFFRDTVSGSFWAILGIMVAAKKVSAQSEDAIEATYAKKRKGLIKKRLGATTALLLILYNSNFVFAENVSRWWDEKEVQTLNVIKDLKQGAGNVLYVDGENGDDRNGGGSLKNSFKTIQNALERLGPGDTLAISAGVYHEKLLIQRSGHEDNRILIGPRGNGEVVIDGSKKMGLWELHEDGIYKTECLFKPAAVVVNEKPFYPEFSLATLREGRWYYDATIKALYICSIDGDDPSHHNIGVVSDDQYQDGILLNGASNITLYGLTVRYAGGRGVSILGHNNCIEKCNIKFNGGIGISMFNYKETITDNTQIIRNHSYHNFLRNWPRGRYKWGSWGAGAGSQGASNTQYIGNVVHKNGGEGLLAYGGKGGTIYRDNIVYDNWSVNIYIDNQANGVIDKNLVYCTEPDPKDLYNNGDENPRDGKNLRRLRAEGIMTADEKYKLNPPANLQNVNISNNVIIGCRRGITHYAQAQGSGLKNISINNNTIILPNSKGNGEEYIGIRIPYNDGNNADVYIKDNVIYGSNPSTYLLSLDTGFPGNDVPMRGLTFDRNTWYHMSNPKPFHVGLSDLSFDSWVNNPKYMKHCVNNLYQEPKFVKGQDYSDIIAQLIRDFKNE